MSKTIEIYGAAVESDSVVSLFKKEVITAKSENGSKPKQTIDVSDILGFKKKPVDVSWLKSASKAYDISPNISDYIAVPVPIISSDIPNRNMQGFMLKTLTEFDSKAHMPRYRTFVGAPTHYEHQNSDDKKAKGVILDASLVPMPEYGTTKVVVLLSFDRTKDAKLVEDILSKRRNSYSMGAVCSYFQCSYCQGVLGPGVVRTCTCPGTDFTKLASYGQIINGKLHYINAGDPQFIETSSVSDPADTGARQNMIL